MPLNPFSDSDQLPETGFTLIEVVMVLVLLGILSAVAVPKYFDLQEDGNRRICGYNRGAILEELMKRSAIARISDDATVFDRSSQSAGLQSSEAIVAEMGGEGCIYGKPCKLHCPSGGTYTVTYARHADGNEDFSVTCFYHGKTASGSGESSSFFGLSDADFEAWLTKYYGSLLDGIFTESKGGKADAVIDSETQSPVLEKIRQALIGEGFDLNQSIITISRRDIGYVDSHGEFIRAVGDPSKDNPNASNPLHWRSELTITVAGKTSDMKAGDTVSGKTYNMTLDFNDKWADNETDIRANGYGPLRPGDNEGQIDCEVKDVDGHLVIRPKTT